MSRMIDRIREKYPYWESQRAGTLSFDSLVREDQFTKTPIPIIVLDNVAEYALKQTNIDKLITQMNDLVIMPPFDLCWLEAQTKYGFRTPANSPQRLYGIGARVQTNKWDLSTPVKRQQFDHEVELIEKRIVLQAEKALRFMGAVYWVSMTISIETKKGLIPTSFLYSLFLDEQGKYVSSVQMSDVNQISMYDSAFLDRSSNGVDGHVASIMAVYSLVFWYGLALLNTKNVKQVEVKPNPKLSKKWQRKKGRPLTTYKTLHIHPMGAKRQTDETGKGTGISPSAHIMRGHFKTYTKEKPLFGSRVGTFWWASQVRGSKDEGVVEKTYEVHPPKGQGGEKTND